MTTNQKQRVLNIRTQINTPNEVIKPMRTEKLLGIIIQNDLKWNEYLLHDEKSLIKQLTSRLNALKIITKIASFKVRLMIANGIFCSKLIFEIFLWGGTEEYLLEALQVIQNKAARSVCKGDKYTAVADLLRQCGWLSVKQLVFFHSVVLVYKTILTTYPKYIYDKLSTQFPYNTRLANTEAVRMGSRFQSRLELTEKSFMNRATLSYNLIPPEIRKVPKLQNFKKKLRKWVVEIIKLK